MSGAVEKEGKESAKERIGGGMEGEEMPIKDGAREGGRGIGPDWER